MPLLTHGRLRSQQAGNAGVVGKLDYRIGNATDGQGVFLTGTEQPIDVTLGPPRNTTTAAYAASLIVSSDNQGTAVPCVLYGLSGFNSKGAAQFIQLYDAKTLPSDTTGVPVITFTVAAASNFSLDFGIRGRRFDRGCIVGNSSTGPTKTIGSADCWFDAQWAEVLV